MKNKRIIFVCTGNTCRSPMAEIILKTKLKLAGIKDVKVSSAGLAMEEGGMNPYSKEALKLLGYKPYPFKSKQLSGDMIKRASAVICMSFSHKQYLKGYANVYTIGEVTGLSDVPDPYGQPLEVYIKTSHLIEDACNVILEKLIYKEQNKI